MRMCGEFNKLSKLRVKIMLILTSIPVNNFYRRTVHTLVSNSNALLAVFYYFIFFFLFPAMGTFYFSGKGEESIMRI